jgi:hypothetical protein
VGEKLGFYLYLSGLCRHIAAQFTSQKKHGVCWNNHPSLTFDRHTRMEDESEERYPPAESKPAVKGGSLKFSSLFEAAEKVCHFNLKATTEMV